MIKLHFNLIRALIYKYASEPPIGIFLHPVDFILLCGLSPKGVWYLASTWGGRGRQGAMEICGSMKDSPIKPDRRITLSVVDSNKSCSCKVGRDERNHKRRRSEMETALKTRLDNRSWSHICSKKNFGAHPDLSAQPSEKASISAGIFAASSH